MRGMIQYHCVKCFRIIAVHPATAYVAFCGRYARNVLWFVHGMELPTFSFGY